MAADRDSTIELGLDLTTVNSALKSMNTLIKESRAEFRNATAAMKNYKTSQEGLEAKQKQLTDTLALQRKTLNRIQEEYNAVAKAEGNDSTAAVNLKSKIDNLTASYKKNASELQSVDTMLDKMGKGAKNVYDNVDDLTRAIKEQETKVQDLALAYKDAKDDSGKFSENARDIRKELGNEQDKLKNLREALDDAKRSTEDFGDKTGKLEDKAKKAKDGFTVLKGALANLVTDGIRKAAEGLKTVVDDVFETGMGFESSMSQVKATMGDISDSDFAMLSDKAKEMGASTKFTAKEAADALNYMALAGYNAKKSAEMLPTVLELAAAGNMDLAQASDMVTDAQTALGLSDKDTIKMVDQMAKASSSSNTSVEQLGSAFLTVGATARSMTGGTKEMATVLGLLADNGIKGAEGGTKLRNMLQKFIKQTDAGANEAKKIVGHMEGIYNSAEDLESIDWNKVGDWRNLFYDKNGNLRKFKDIMTDINKYFNDLGMSKKERDSVISNMFNSRDLKAVNALLSTTGKRWDELDGKLKKSQGSSKKMADTMIDNVEGRFTILKSQVDGVFLKIFEKLKPYLMDAMNVISDLLSKIDIDKVASSIGDAIKKVIDWVKKIDLNSLAETITNVITGIIDGIKLVIDWIGKVIENFPKIVDEVKAIGTVLLTVFAVKKITEFIGGITGVVTAFKTAKGALDIFSAGLSALPLLAVVGGIAAIVTSLIGVEDESDRAERAMEKMSEDGKQAVEDINTAYDDLKSDSEDLSNKIGDIKFDTKNIEDMIKKYDSLLTKDGKIRKGHEKQAEAIKTKIIDALGLEEKEFDAIIKKNKKIGNQLNDQLKLHEAIALEKAFGEKYGDAQANMSKLSDDWSKAEQAVKDEQDRIKQMKEQLHQLYVERDNLPLGILNPVYAGKNSAILDLKDEIRDADANIGTLKEAEKKAKEALDEAKRIVSSYEELRDVIETGSPTAISRVVKKITLDVDVTGPSEEVKAELETKVADFNRRVKDAIEKGIPVDDSDLVTLTEQIKALYESAYGKPLDDPTLVSMIKARIQAFSGNIPAWFVNGIDTGSITAEQAEAKLSKYVEFNNLLNKAKSYGLKVPSELSSGIILNGYDVEDAIKDLNGYFDFYQAVDAAKDAGLDIPKKLTKAIENGTADVKDATKVLNDSTKLAGKNNVKGGQRSIDTYVNGLTGKKTEHFKQIDKLNDDYQKRLAQGDYTKPGEENGGEYVDGVVSGVESKRSVVVDKVASLLYDNGIFSKGSKIGKQYAEGICNGLASGENLLNSIVPGLGDAMTKPIRKKLKINSPSKVGYEIGDFYGQGLVNGITANTKPVGKASKGLGDSAVDALKDTLEIHSPSKVTSDIGKMAADGFFEGFREEAKQGIKKVKADFYSTVDEFKALINMQISKLTDGMKSNFESISSGIQNGLKMLSTGVGYLRFDDLMSRAGVLAGSIVTTAKSAVKSVWDEMKNIDGFNFSEVGSKAQNVFSKAIEKKISYTQKNLQYNIEQRLKQYDDVVAGLTTQQQAEEEKLTKALEDVQNRIETGKSEYVANLEDQYSKQQENLNDLRDENIKKWESIRDKEVEELESNRDREIEELEKKRDKAKTNAEKKRLEKEITRRKNAFADNITTVQDYYNNLIQVENDNGTLANEALKNQYEEGKKLAEEQWDSALQREKEGYEQQLEQARKGYEALIKEQQQYKDTFQEGANLFVEQWQEALNEYKEAATELVNETVSSISEKYQKMYDNLSSKQDNLISKLKDSSKLFSISGANVLRVEDVKQQTKEIQGYANQLQSLKGKVSDVLLEQISAVDMKEGKAFMDYLAKMSPDDLKAYDEAVVNKYKTAEELGKKVYESDMSKLKDDYTKELTSTFSTLPNKMQEIGRNIMSGLTEGLLGGIDYMDQAIQAICGDLLSSFRQQLGIHSPSKAMMTIGEYTGQGFELGLKSSMGDAIDAQKSAISALLGTARSINGKVATGINAASGRAGISNTSNSVVNNYNLVQNNNSPKSLSALDTYQARREQMAQLRLFAGGAR